MLSTPVIHGGEQRTKADLAGAERFRMVSLDCHVSTERLRRKSCAQLSTRANRKLGLATNERPGLADIQ